MSSVAIAAASTSFGSSRSSCMRAPSFTKITRKFSLERKPVLLWAYTAVIHG